MLHAGTDRGAISARQGIRGGPAPLVSTSLSFLPACPRGRCRDAPYTTLLMLLTPRSSNERAGRHGSKTSRDKRSKKRLARCVCSAGRSAACDAWSRPKRHGLSPVLYTYQPRFQKYTTQVASRGRTPELPGPPAACSPGTPRGPPGLVSGRVPAPRAAPLCGAR